MWFERVQQHGYIMLVAWSKTHTKKAKKLAQLSRASMSIRMATSELLNQNPNRE